MFKLLTEALVTRNGMSVEVRTKDGKIIASDSVEANLLFEILQQLKKGGR